MVTEDIKFKDGSKIYHETTNSGVVYRNVKYSYEEAKRNGSKYHYLSLLEESYRVIGEQTYKLIEHIYKLATKEYNPAIVREICFILRSRGCYPGEEAFFTLIYLAMVDLEQGKLNSSWPGKKIVLDSCRAVLLEDTPYEEAAIMNTK